MRHSLIVILFAVSSYLGCGIIICALILLRLSHNPFNDVYGRIIPGFSWIFLTITAIPCGLISIKLLKGTIKVLMSGFIQGALLIEIFFTLVLSMQHILPISILNYTNLIPPFALIVITGIVTSVISFIISFYCVKFGYKIYVSRAGAV